MQLFLHSVSVVMVYNFNIISTKVRCVQFIYFSVEYFVGLIRFLTTVVHIEAIYMCIYVYLNSNKFL